MTSSTPPGPYDDGAPNSAFILENGQTLGGEDVFTEGTIGSQPAILHTRDRASEVLLDRLPVAP